MFTEHMQQGSNVWYCPEQIWAVQIKDGKPGHPTYAERVCPVCGEQVTPERIR